MYIVHSYRSGNDGYSRVIAFKGIKEARTYVAQEILYINTEYSELLVELKEELEVAFNVCDYYTLKKGTHIEFPKIEIRHTGFEVTSEKRTLLVYIHHIDEINGRAFYLSG